ncbi:MAG: hypothetical protein ACI4ST_00415 [Candidatus Gallimonas sp.]
MRYAVAASDEVWFYAETDETSGLFLVPYSYCVRIVGESGNFVQAEYGGKDGLPVQKGYCLRDGLLFLDYEPERPFFVHLVKLVYKLETPAQEELSYSREAYFYGYYPSGSARYLRVLLDGELVLVGEAEPLSIPTTDYIPSQKTNSPAAETGSSRLSALQIVIVCIACAATVVVAVLVMRGKKPVQSPDERAEL